MVTLLAQATAAAIDVGPAAAALVVALTNRRELQRLRERVDTASEG